MGKLFLKIIAITGVLLVGVAILTPRDGISRHALLTALKHDDTNYVLRYFSKGMSPNVNIRANSGQLVYETPLHIAASSGSADCLLLLLKFGADVNQTNSIGSTPLISVVTSEDDEKHLQCFRLLLKNGADVKPFDGEKRNALIWASTLGQLPFVTELNTAS